MPRTSPAAAKPRVGDEAVERATGHAWAEWFRWLDQQGARSRTHKEIVALLDARDVSPWWCQTITVEYEKARGKRVSGQSADVGFEVGVRRMFPGSREEAWRRLTSPAGLRAWLGGSGRVKLEPGTSYRFRDGTSGEIRVVRPGEMVRLTWQPPGWEKPSTIQARVSPRSGGRCGMSFHHEKLPDRATRAAMRERWKEALAALGCEPGIGDQGGVPASKRSVGTPRSSATSRRA